jgi:transglutaminase-like putative cysteine protease
MLRAQFQQPTDEELKMTAEPKAPGAAAIYLYREEIDNDPLHYRTIYERIKVLSEKGKDLGIVVLPYVRGDWKITDIQARTIHADGTILPLQGKPEDLLSLRAGDLQADRKVFKLPDVEVGSILEYRYEIRYDDNHFSSPLWEVQQPYFIRKAHYSFVPFDNFKPGNTMASNRYLVDEKGRAISNLIWWYRLPNKETVKTDVGGHYTVDVTDVPASPNEEWMPPIQSLLYKTFFYYKPSRNSADFWMSEARDWAKDEDRFAEPSKFLKDEVARLVAPTDSGLDKTKKLYAAVQALDNTDYSRKQGETERHDLKLKDTKHAEDVWRQKSGDSEEIALLYLALLRAAGLQAYPIKVVARNHGVFDPTYMSLGQLDDTLVTLQIDGHDYTLDPGEKMCPFGTLNWRHAGARGLTQDSKGPGVVQTPNQSYKDNGTTRTGVVTLDAHGELSGNLQFVYTGQQALHWRQFLLRNDLNALKKNFDRALEGQVPKGVEAHVDHFLGLDTPEVNLVAVIKLQGQLGTGTARRMMLPGLFFEAHGHRPFVDEEKRQTPVDMHYAEKVTDQITYKLPEGYTVEGAPQDDAIKWEGHATYVVKTAQQPGQIIVARILARAFDQAKPEEYQDLRGFYQKIAAADEQQLVLVKAAADSSAVPAGN